MLCRFTLHVFRHDSLSKSTIKPPATIDNSIQTRLRSTIRNAGTLLLQVLVCSFECNTFSCPSYGKTTVVVDCVRHVMAIYVDGTLEPGLYSSGSNVRNFPRSAWFNVTTQDWFGIIHCANPPVQKFLCLKCVRLGTSVGDTAAATYSTVSSTKFASSTYTPTCVSVLSFHLFFVSLSLGGAESVANS